MRLRKQTNLLIGAALIAGMLCMLVVSLIYLPYDVNEMNIGVRFQQPGAEYWLGTDNFGRDILSRIMQGSQTAFTVGFTAVFIGGTLGTIIGAIAGYAGGWIDEALMRLMDSIMAFPGILFALMLIAVFEPNLTSTIMAIGFMSIPGFSRIVRSGFIQYKQRDFVLAARGIGCSRWRLMAVHIFPNVVAPLIVAASMSFSAAILTEAGLSYLGLGVQPPNPSWGRMLNEAQGYLAKAPWYTLAPGIMITLTVLGFNLLGDGIRDLRDPRMGEGIK